MHIRALEIPGSKVNELKLIRGAESTPLWFWVGLICSYTVLTPIGARVMGAKIWCVGQLGDGTARRCHSVVHFICQRLWGASGYLVCGSSGGCIFLVCVDGS